MPNPARQGHFAYSVCFGDRTFFQEVSLHEAKQWIMYILYVDAYVMFILKNNFFVFLLYLLLCLFTYRYLLFFYLLYIYIYTYHYALIAYNYSDCYIVHCLCCFIVQNKRQPNCHNKLKLLFFLSVCFFLFAFSTYSSIHAGNTLGI